MLSNSNHDVGTAYGAFGDDSSDYQELSESEYILSILIKWPALAQMNGLAVAGPVPVPSDETNKTSLKEKS